MRAEISRQEETPELAAKRIADALTYVQREANAAGMSNVGEQIGQAIKRINELRSP